MRWLVVVALVVAGCGASLSDGQRLWCESHDMTQLPMFGSNDGAVIDAAARLGIAIPDELRAANLYFTGAATNRAILPPEPPTDWPDQLKAWRGTSDYARACVATYESAH